MKASSFVLAIVAIFALAAGYQLFLSSSPVEAPTPASGPPPVEPAHLNLKPGKDAVIPKITLDDLEWRKEAGGAVAIISANIRNQSAVGVRDVEITCSSSGQSGTPLGFHRKTVYQSLCSGCSKSVQGLNVGLIDSQTYSLRCGVSDAALN